MSQIVTTTPAHYCPLPCTDRRRAYVPAHKTDIRRTISEHTRMFDITDQAIRIESRDHIERAGDAQ